MTSDTLREFIDRNCQKLAELVDNPVFATGKGLFQGLLASAAPREAAGRIEDLLSTAKASTVEEILQEPESREALLATVAGSQFLFSVINRHLDLLKAVYLRRGYLTRKTRTVMEADLRESLGNGFGVSQFNHLLRTYKEREYLRIGCRDLAELASLEQVMQELSDLAGACIQTTLEYHWNRLTAIHGRPPGTGNHMGFVVLGMGKVSGGELNFSSDVDLVFVRIEETGRTDGPQPVSTTGFYESLATSVTKSLSEVTEDGFVFRIDLRLRPEGEKGQLVPSFQNTVDYYLHWGRTWERAALMKAVPIAGDRALGSTLLKALEPFVYRKYLDYSTLEDMRDMKRRIQTTLKRKPGINIKLGQGGIREIEFFVQTLQLINAGKAPQVRSASTLEALALLNRTGILEDGTAGDLNEAYCFFRKTEHRIQINHQLQTHELPRTPEQQGELARRMGYRGEKALPEFLSELERRRTLVGDLFSSLFYHAEEREDIGVSQSAQQVCDTIHDQEASLKLLADLGFENPAVSYPILKNLIIPSDQRILSEKGRSLLERLAPLFVDELLKGPEPGVALLALDSYVDSLRSGPGYLSTLLENPPTVRFLVRILSESRFFTELLIRHPQSIDSLIARYSSEPLKERDDLVTGLVQRLAYCESYESELDVLRTFKNEEILRIGVSHLNDETDSTTARWLISELAEVCLEAAVTIALKEMGRKFGEYDFFDELPFIILGMGKLGGQEMTYLSDLDVIFIYDPPSESIGRFAAHEWFSRLASRVISILSVPTAEGIAFEIDTRLRPSGNQGPLVSSLSSFREYHKSTSKLWEKQALVRARPVTGPYRLRDEVQDIIKDCLVRTRTSRDDLDEIDRLRRRMEYELALEDSLHVDLKTGHGGLVDVEFFVQGKILRHVDRLSEILCHNTLEALARLNRAELMDDESFRVMDSGYRFLTNLEDRLRILEHRSVDRIRIEGDRVKGLAHRLGYGSGGEKAFLDDYFRVTGSIRKIYDSFFTARTDSTLG